MTIKDLKNITFGDWLAYWFKTYKQPFLSAYSLRNIEQVIRLHTPDWLKAKRLKQLTIFDIDRALADIPPSRTFIYTRQVWHNSLVKACKLGLIDKNVVDLSDTVRYKKRRSSALTISEQTEFIKALEGKRYKWLMLFYLCSGVRRAEALCLKWSDVNFNECIILICGTKTEGSFRYIVMTDDLKVILDGQRKQSDAEVGTRFENKTAYVFNYSMIYVSRIFKDLCPNHHLHDLRHTYITRCAESGMNVTVCQQLVGHSTPNLTLGIYTHVMDEFKRSEAAKFTLNPKFNKKDPSQ